MVVYTFNLMIYSSSFSTKNELNFSSSSSNNLTKLASSSDIITSVQSSSAAIFGRLASGRESPVAKRGLISFKRFLSSLYDKNLSLHSGRVSSIWLLRLLPNFICLGVCKVAEKLGRKSKERERE